MEPTKNSKMIMNNESGSLQLDEKRAILTPIKKNMQKDGSKEKSNGKSA